MIAVATGGQGDAVSVAVDNGKVIFKLNGSVSNQGWNRI